MDYMQQQQWRNPPEQQDQPPSAKIPKLLLDENQASEAAPAAASLSLSVEQPNSRCLSSFPDPSLTRYSGGTGFFSLAQWQELELQALIFKYMLAGASVPLDLVLLVMKSLLNTPTYYHHHHNLLPYYPQHYLHYQPSCEFNHYQPSLLQTEYWGNTLDSEPGRCRRTDGKKWRCSRDVVNGQKYCERHIRRGQNRSRKPVEIPMPPNAPSGGNKANISAPSMEATKGAHFTLSGSLPLANDLLHLNQRSRSYLKSHLVSHSIS